MLLPFLTRGILQSIIRLKKENKEKRGKRNMFGKNRILVRDQDDILGRLDPVFFQDIQHAQRHGIVVGIDHVDSVFSVFFQQVGHAFLAL